MKVATILPQNFLNLVKGDSYHMCLAHLIDKPGMENYTRFFKNGIADDSYVIMDNGLIEGNPRPIEELIEKADMLGANELILPDVFKNSVETIKAVGAAMSYLENHPTDINLMAVPQGKNLPDWLCCAEMLLQYPIKCLGIPKVLVSMGGRDGRLQALDALYQRCPEISGLDIHLLGCWQTPLEILTIAKAESQGLIPTIRGVDSAIPYVYARAGLRISDDDRPDSEPVNFEHGEVQNDLLLALNIEAWRDSI